MAIAGQWLRATYNRPGYDLPRSALRVAANTGHSSRLAESGRLVRRMSHRVDPAAIAEEARTVRLDAVNHGSNPGPFDFLPRARIRLMTLPARLPS
jgi:hypothetical protein